MLACVGSEHPVSLGQLERIAPLWVRTREGTAGADPGRSAPAKRQRGRQPAAAGLTRPEATRRIQAAFAQLLWALPPPPSLLVTGGETLRGICLGLGVQALEVQGEILPGIPLSVLRGGPWQGVQVVSKSGALGTPDLLRCLLTNGVY